MGAEMLHETIWFDKHRYDEAEERYQGYLNGTPSSDQESQSQANVNKTSLPSAAPVATDQAIVNKNENQSKGSSTSVKEIAEARRKIQQTLSAAPAAASPPSPSVSEKRIAQLEAENKELRQKTEDLTEALKKLELRVTQLESSKTAAPAPTSAKEEKKEEPKEEKKEEEKQEKKEEKEEDSDSDVDLFGSDSDSEEDADYEKIKQERLAAYQAKRAHKPKVIAKSTITLDVKPWDDETDMVKLEECVRSVKEDGLVWGGSQILPVAYGIKKLQIACVVEDDKVGTELLDERICEFEEYIQSVDIVAFNKL